MNASLTYLNNRRLCAWQHYKVLSADPTTSNEALAEAYEVYCAADDAYYAAAGVCNCKLPEDSCPVCSRVAAKIYEDNQF